ncbi:hypothetical protein DSO57_1009634 [Entomophthora muscae]|uniref:Uncharacterized protein n=1 Tax=Entomophthora muscae TaxID=34485 RepID=A0ACC2U5B3_9FUNG|nr:hypothetical protein DSO57_1009634 [Entomophthora muscae]
MQRLHFFEQLLIPLQPPCCPGKTLCPPYPKSLNNDNPSAATIPAKSPLVTKYKLCRVSASSPTATPSVCVLELGSTPSQTPIVEEVSPTHMPQVYHLGGELPTVAQALLQILFAPSSLCTLTSGGHGEHTNADKDNSLLVQGSSSGLATSLAVWVDKNNLHLPAGLNLEVACAALPPSALGGCPPNPPHPVVLELKFPTEDTISSI